MPSEFFVQRMKVGTVEVMVPAHESDLEALKKFPVHQPIRCKVTRIRNVDHHRKYFALLNYAYDVWEPPETEDGVKNFDRFRKDIIILCGFYDQWVRLNGEVRLEPKSMSFANMDQDEFEVLYDKTIDVIIKYVLRNYTGDELRAVVDQVMEFDS